MERRVIILGSTGSIGTQALGVIAHLNALADAGSSPLRFRVVGLAAGRNADLLAAQARRFAVADLALASSGAAPPDARTFRGPNAAEELVRAVECDLVLAAIVGIAGLPATLAAVELGRDVALANKETLVAAGALVIPAARRSGARLLPVDSEHSAIGQCLAPCIQGTPDGKRSCSAAPPLALDGSVHRLILTASGGALRSLPTDRLRAATPEQALKHPTWTMGPKVTIDSASLMNKALELIEAHWLFGAPADRLAAVLHPESVVHALVELVDGSVLAHLAAPDMKVPIQHALTWPHRLPGGGRRLNPLGLGALRFEPVDPDRYPALALAHRAIESGGTAGAILNAANEAAVDAFLRQERPIPFGWIADVAADAMRSIPVKPAASLGAIMEADALARRFVLECP
ncbi:MAG: 1-deoxy-D-xylulose-5-phosphate reductoisomerase [Phycisphaerae bacterium]|nr:1-deoxy-D-xylulose-5-phosphate reductoisomerase [Phycisphaerae bacterium]